VVFWEWFCSFFVYRVILLRLAGGDFRKALANRLYTPFPLCNVLFWNVDSNPCFAMMIMAGVQQHLIL
jgi:hypothetical protein